MTKELDRLMTITDLSEMLGVPVALGVPVDTSCRRRAVQPRRFRPGTTPSVSIARAMLAGR
jgi:hypothetical protein